MKPSSLSNRQQTLLRKLNQKKYRQKEQLFLVEGARAVHQVISNGLISVQYLVFDEHQSYWQKSSWNQISADITCLTVESGIFTELSDTDHPQGVLALCEIPPDVTAKQLSEKRGVIVALDALQDPGNMGTLLRSAAWFGVQGMIAGRGSVNLFHPKVVRATAGAMGAIPHINGSLSTILPAFEAAGWQILLLDAGPDAVSLQQTPKTNRTIICVGNEANGIDSALMKPGRTRIKIPSPHKKPPVESLNAAVAACIAIHEVV